MRKINKMQPIASFHRFVRANPTANWSDFHKIGKEIFWEVRDHILLQEQDFLCGYTEVPIDDSDSHLDHFVKRDFAPNRIFDWNNLIASCNYEYFGAKFKDNTFRIKRTDYALIFNPVEDDVQRYFYYNEFGEIEAKPNLDPFLKEKVEKTITVFNLKHPSLVERRKKIIGDIRSYSDAMLDMETIKTCLSASGFKSLVEQYCDDKP